MIYCHDIDVVDGTPLLDIKPYVKQFDHKDNPKCGWYDLVDWQAIWDEITSCSGEGTSGVK